MRYIKVVGGKLGSRQFGTVHKAIDADSGKFIAVKILEQPTRKSKQEEERMLI
jgi:serine/threonine protein kinase